MSFTYISNYLYHLFIMVVLICYIVISVNVCHVYAKDHNGNKCVHFLCYPNI